MAVNRVEQGIQIATVQRIGFHFPLKTGLMLHHSRNEGNRSAKNGGRADGAIGKAMGLSPGFPDLVLYYRKEQGYLEVKAPKKYLSPEQKDWRDYLIDAGYHWALIRSQDEAMEALASWGWCEGLGLGRYRVI